MAINWKDPVQRAEYQRKYAKRYRRRYKKKRREYQRFWRERNRVATGRSEIERAATLSEVGQVLGLTGERVRQIEAQALRKLRVELKRRGITGPGAIPGESVWERLLSEGV